LAIMRFNVQYSLSATLRILRLRSWSDMVPDFFLATFSATVQLS
jgi:hypothetical protein